MKKHKFFTSKNSQHVLNVVGKVGAGIVIPKTDVTLFGERLDNVFHVAGYVTGLESGLRYEFRKTLFTKSWPKELGKLLQCSSVGTGKANHTFYREFIYLDGGAVSSLGNW
ncbi:MAG: hypothetical protein IPI10_16195 [Bacteroidetes bacterium]|nr:hypothetical protein [Bacteroidota bacterium]